MIIPTGWAQVNVVMGGLALPRKAQCVYGGQLVAGSPLVTPQDHANFCRQQWEIDIMPLLAQSVSLLEVRVKFGPNDTGLDASSTSTNTGGINGPAEAPQVSALVRKITTQGGRMGKGRMFLPGLLETSISGGNVDVPSQTAINNAFDDWLAAHSTAQFPVALLHSVPAISPFIVTDMQCQLVAATQRRRIRKVGGRKVVGP